VVEVFDGLLLIGKLVAIPATVIVLVSHWASQTRPPSWRSVSSD
jgi:hypothetical protein